MNVLVTGGAGYIGSHTCKVLSRNGHRPVSLDNLSTGNEWSVKWGPLYKGDIQDQALVKKIVLKEQIDAVIHFAASAYVSESVEKPFKYFKNNIVNSTAFLEALAETSIRKIVFSSTCAIYGQTSESSILESSPQEPINPYGATKLAVEQLLKALAISHGMDSISLRYFNAAGADPDREIGEWHQPETHLIPRTIEVAMNKSEISIYGTDYKTPDGSCVRDYIHVLDLAEAHLKALEKLNFSKGAQACNLGTGKGYSVCEIINAVEKLLDTKIQVSHQARRPGDPDRLVANSELAKTFLNWSAKYELADIILHSYKWIKNRKKDKK